MHSEYGTPLGLCSGTKEDGQAAPVRIGPLGFHGISVEGKLEQVKKQQRCGLALLLPQLVEGFNGTFPGISPSLTSLDSLERGKTQECAWFTLSGCSWLLTETRFT